MPNGVIVGRETEVLDEISCKRYRVFGEFMLRLYNGHFERACGGGSRRARKRATGSRTEDIRVVIQDSVEQRIVKFAGSSDLNASGLGGNIVDADQAEGSLRLRSRQMALKS